MIVYARSSKKKSAAERRTTTPAKKDAERRTTTPAKKAAERRKLSKTKDNVLSILTQSLITKARKRGPIFAEKHQIKLSSDVMNFTETKLRDELHHRLLRFSHCYYINSVNCLA